MFRNIIVFLTSFPPKIIFWKIACKAFRIQLPQKEKWQDLVKNKTGIEVGGPSSLFKSNGYLPLYPVIDALDGINFSTTTVWEGNLSEGYNYNYNGKTGFQFIAEGTALPQIEENKYDFVLSCNNLEHIANPIVALFEWKRIIKKDGAIVLVLPNKKANFDHKRPYTTIAHLADDFKNNVSENDNTHLPEILSLHDLERDPQAGSLKNFHERCLDNINNRCMHHHVFNQILLKELFDYCGMDVKLQYSSLTDHFVLAVKK